MRESYRTDKSIEWVKVHRLPDFVYFNHSIHVNKGVGCSTCHGQVNQMPLMFQAKELTMQWCLDCHRDPAKNLRPHDQIVNMDWQAPANQAEVGQETGGGKSSSQHVRSDELLNLSSLEAINGRYARERQHSTRNCSTARAEMSMTRRA